MMRRDMLSVGGVTAYLFIYLTLLQFEGTRAYGFFMLLFAPLLLCWMVYTVLKYGIYNGQDLGNEEFGYEDKPKDQLGTL